MKKCWQQQNFDSDPKEAWQYNHVTLTPIATNFMLYCRLIYVLFMPYVRERERELQSWMVPSQNNWVESP